jgi:hypothetical protein
MRIDVKSLSFFYFLPSENEKSLFLSRLFTQKAQGCTWNASIFTRIAMKKTQMKIVD